MDNTKIPMLIVVNNAQLTVPLVITQVIVNLALLTSIYTLAHVMIIVQKDTILMLIAFVKNVQKDVSLVIKTDVNHAYQDSSYKELNAFKLVIKDISVIQLQTLVFLVDLNAHHVLMLIPVLDVLKDMFYKEELVKKIVMLDTLLLSEVFVYLVILNVLFVYQEFLAMSVLEIITYKEILVLNNVMMLIIH